MATSPARRPTTAQPARSLRGRAWSFAARSVLATQSEAGASADVFVSADREWMGYLEQRALIKPGSRRDLLR
jgi:ABC-type molybdate transport system substrate-binding protein